MPGRQWYSGSMAMELGQELEYTSSTSAAVLGPVAAPEYEAASGGGLGEPGSCAGAGCAGALDEASEGFC